MQLGFLFESVLLNPGCLLGCSSRAMLALLIPPSVHSRVTKVLLVVSETAA